MKNSNSGSFLMKSNKPSSFRMMMKQRTSQKQRLVEFKQVSNSQAVRHERTVQMPINHTNNFAEIKNYVKKRMRTQYSDRFNGDGFISKLNPADKSLIDGEIKQTSTVGVKQLKTQLNSTLNKSKAQLEVSKWIESDSHSQRKQGSQIYEQNSETLDSLQKKIEQLLMQRLNICVQGKDNRNEQVEKQLQKVMQQLKEVRKDNPQTVDSNIACINQRLRVIEKIMAENYTEAEIIKKDFLRKMANRSSHRRFPTQISTSSFSRVSMSRYNESPLRTSIVNSTTNKQTYKKPELAAYQLYKHQNKFFNADRHRQPLPRSSYNRDYLICPQISDKQVRPYDNNILSRHKSTNLLQSSYQLSFVAKEAEKVDIKELDACKDKIKDVPVLFGRKAKSSLQPSRYNVLINKIRQAIGQKKPVVPQINVSPQKLLTESRREYRLSEDKRIASSIKHQNLLKLKYEYRKKLFI